MKRYPLFIDGAAVETTDEMPVPNPSTGEQVGVASVADEATIDAAVSAAAKAFPRWRDLPDDERRDYLRRCADVIEANAEELAVLLSKEQGKPLNGLGARFELGGVVASMRFVADLVLPTETIVNDESTEIIVEREALGPVLSITPWNWPLMIASQHAAQAIRVGNTVVQKPSPFAPLSTLRMIELVGTVLPAGVWNSIAGPDAIGPLLTAHPGFAKVVFTGSTATGARVMESAAGSLKRVTLELGGNDAAIVLPDVDPEAAAEGLFWGAFINNGQTCAAIKRLYVHDAIYERVCAAILAYSRNIKVGDGLAEGSILGPLQNRRQRDKVERLVDEAKAGGARILCGGEAAPGPGNFYPITLVADATDDMALVQEEQFGPALPIIRFTDADEVVARANATAMGLGGSVWTADKAQANALARRLECGTVWINKHANVRPDTPFGGWKASGVGTQSGVEGLKEFTAMRVIWE